LIPECKIPEGNFFCDQGATDVVQL
jgi:hypothetical protein